jgi:hypothetical protein
MEHLMFRATGFSLFLPTAEKLGLIENKACIGAPFPQSLAPGTIHHREAAQLAELLRELWDFR